MAEPDEHANSYAALLKILDQQDAEVVRICMKHMQNSSLFTWANMFGWAICGRAAALSSGFRSMVEQKNSLCAVPLVRLQLDNVLRLYAGFFSADHQEFCKAVLGGERIDRMKSKGGQRMTDKWLVKQLGAKNPWMESVYETTSGYVHLSGKHIHHIMRKLDDGDLEMRIGPTDQDRGPEQYLEMLRCMRHLNAILTRAVDDWLGRMCSPDGEIVPDPDRLGA